MTLLALHVPRLVMAGKLDGTIQGKQFEQIFERIARLRGYWPRKIPLSARYIGPGRILPIKSELDYQLIHSEQGVAFLDTKTYLGERFAFSKLDPHQVELAVRLNQWNQPAGFVVWFRDLNAVSFFSGQDIVQKGPSSSFGPNDGLILGDVPNFTLSGIYTRACCPL